MSPIAPFLQSIHQLLSDPMMNLVVTTTLTLVALRKSPSPTSTTFKKNFYRATSENSAIAR
jgi:hypothetical protein